MSSSTPHASALILRLMFKNRSCSEAASSDARPKKTLPAEVAHVSDACSPSNLPTAAFEIALLSCKVNGWDSIALTRTLGLSL